MNGVRWQSLAAGAAAAGKVAIHQKKRVSFDDAANAADAVLLVFQEAPR